MIGGNDNQTPGILRYHNNFVGMGPLIQIHAGNRCTHGQQGQGGPGGTFGKVGTPGENHGKEKGHTNEKRANTAIVVVVVDVVFVMISIIGCGELRQVHVNGQKASITKGIHQITVHALCRGGAAG